VELFSVVFTVTFDQPVTGVDAADFRVVSDNVLTFNPALTVAGSGSVYTVTIDAIRGTGRLRLDLVDDDSIAGAAFPLGSEGAANGSFTGPTYTLAPDATLIAPFVQSITRVSPTSARTVASSATYNVAFSEPVTGVDAADFQVATTGNAAGVVGTVSATDAAHYVVTINNITGVGQIGLNFIDDGSVRDSDGAILGNAVSLFRDQYIGAGAITVGDLNNDGIADLAAGSDGVAYVALLIGNGDGSFRPAVKYDAMLRTTSVSIGDVNRDGIIDFVSTNQSDGTASAFLGNGNGTFQAQRVFPANAGDRSGAIVDINGDGRPDFVSLGSYSYRLSILFGQDGRFTGDTFFEDPVLPTAAAPNVLSMTLNAPTAPPTGASSVSYTVVFSEPVTGLDAGDFAVAGTGTAQATLPLAVAGSGATYTVTLNGVAGDGTLTLNLVDDNSNRDADNNPLITPNAAFANQTTFAAGGDIVSVAATDLNGDGKLDIVAGGQTSQSIALLLGNGDGTFRPATPIAVGKQAPYVAVADLNKDGKSDIVVGTGSGGTGNVVMVFLGNGDATFRPPVSMPLTDVGVVTTGDLNNDGSLDIVAAAGGKVGIALGNGNGTFKPVATISTENSRSVALGDVDGDGKLDIAFANQAPLFIGIMLGNGDGTFKPRLTYSGLNNFPQSVALGDLSADGKLDFAFLTANGRSVGVYLGNGDGIFVNKTTIEPGDRDVQQILISDINRDGRPDLVVANNGLATFLGNGDGTFRPYLSLAAQTGETGLVVADFNADGRPDIAGGGKTSQSVGVLIAKRGNFTAPTIAVDHTGPITTIGTRPAASTRSTTADFSFSASDPTLGSVTAGVHHFEYQLDGGSFTTAVSPVTVSVLTSGTHTFRVRAVDNAGNIGLAAEYSWVVDLSPQLESISRLTPAWGLTAEASVTYQVAFRLPVTGVDAADFAVALSGVTIAPPLTVTPVSASIYNVTINGITGSGTLALNLIDNGSIRAAADGSPLAPGDFGGPSYIFNHIDPLAMLSTNVVPENKPAGTIVGTLSGNDPSAGGTFTFSLPADVGDNAAFTVSGAALQTAASFDYEAKSTYTLTVHVTHVSGLGYDKVFTITVGNVVENAIVYVDDDWASLAAGSPIVDADSSLVLDVVVTAPDGGSVGVFLGNGDGTLRPRMTFAAGPKPRAAFIADMNKDGRPDLVVANRDEGSVVLLLGNGNGAFGQPMALPLGPTKAKNGDESRQVAVADFNGDGRPDVAASNGLGNYSLSVLLSANGSFAGDSTSVDQAPPTATLASTPPPATNGNSSFYFTGNDPTSGGLASGIDHFEFQLDTGGFIAATSPVALSNLAEGNHMFAIRAVDKAGNVGAAATYSWAIDLTAPTALIGTAPAVTDGTATFSLSAADLSSGGVSSGVHHLEWKLDGGAFSTVTSPATLTNLPGGNHTIAVRAVDNAGNVGSAATFTWLVDFGPPTAPAIVRLNPTWSLTGAASVTYQVTFNEPVTGVDAADFGVSVAGLAITSPLVVTPVSASVYNVTLNGVTGSGALSLNLVDDDSIRDVLDLPLVTTGAVLGPAYIFNRIDPLATLGANAIAENNVVGAMIGTLSANDPSAGGAFTFSLPGGLADNSAFNLDGPALQAGIRFDFETKSTYTAIVRVTHNSGLSYDKSFTIAVQNVVETPTVYVDDDWANLSDGAAVPDADPSLAGNQPATIGVTAFASLAAALANVDAGGMGVIVVSPGAYTGNATLDRPVALHVAGPVVVSGILSGSQSLVKQGASVLTLTGANTYMGGTTIAAGTLQIGNGGVGGSIIGSVAVIGALVFNRSDAITFAGIISGTGNVVQAGSGTLTFGGANTYQGGLTVNRGVLVATADNQVGDSRGVVNINSPGRLTIAASMTSSRSFFSNNGMLQVDAGATLTLADAEISGGFLSGPGTIATAAGGAFSTTFAGVTSQTSLAINANGADVFVSFTNNGSVVLSNQGTTTLEGFRNSNFGRLVVNGAANVSDFNTLGQVTVNGVIDNVGASDLGFGGVTTINAGGVVDLEATDAIVAGGLVKNNGAFGSATNTITVDFGGSVKGAGIFGNVVTQNGGLYAPGNSPGSATTNQYNLNGGGALEFEVSNATGTAGGASGWDLVVIAPTQFNLLSGVVELTATPDNRYTIFLASRLDSGDRAAGPAANFNPTQAYAWKFADMTNTAAAFSGSFDPADFTIDASGFVNAFQGDFSVDRRDGGKSLYVVYTPAAASTTVTLVAVPNATTGGELVTLTATVSPNPGGLGTVTFFDGGAALGTSVPVSGGVATLQIASLAAGSHLLRADFGGAAGVAAAASNVVSLNVGAAPLQVSSVTPNGGLGAFAGAQRSRVVDVTAAFNQPVSLDPGAVSLGLHRDVTFAGVSQPAGLGVVPADLVLTSTDNIIWTVTFVGAGTVDVGSDGFSSLKDGVYDFTIEGAKVHQLGNASASMAGQSTTTFHRFFGDTDAPSTPAGGALGVNFAAVVNSGDNLAFRTAFNRPAPDYQSFLDFDGNGVISTGDNFEFRSRFNKTLAWRV
jgi:autotransporter-associated beta strand protein